MKVRHIFTLLLLMLTSSLPLWADTTYSLIQADTINTKDFMSKDLAFENLSENIIVSEVTYARSVVMTANSREAKSNNPSAVIRYDAKTDNTQINIVGCNVATSGSGSSLYCTIVEEGQTYNKDEQRTEYSVAVSTNTGLKTIESESDKNRSFYFHLSNETNLRFLAIIIIEKGTNLHKAGDADYSINFNQGRFLTKTGITKIIDDMEITTSADYQAFGTSYVSIKNTNCIKFDVTTDAKLTVTVSDALDSDRTFYVTKTVDGTENFTTPASPYSFDYELSSGTWYIRPAASNKTVQITSLAFTSLATKYDVSFIVDGDQVGETQKVTDGENAVAPTPNPTKVGYRFVGWSTTTSADDIQTVASYAITENTTFTAIWEEATTYWVSFNSKGGSTVDTIYVIENEYITTPPADPTKVGYNFLGWSLTDGGAVVEDITEDAVTANMTFYAKWETTPYNVFSLTMVKASSVKMNSSTPERHLSPIDDENEDEDVTIVGGTAYVGCTDSNDKTVLNSNRIQMIGDKVYVKLLLDDTIREGDTIKFTNTNSNTYQLCFTATPTRSITWATEAIDDVNRYVVGSTSDLIGHNIIYVWRSTTTTAYISTLTITRPNIEEHINKFYTLSFNTNGATTETPASQVLLAGVWPTVEPATPEKGTDEFLGWFVGDNEFTFGSALSGDVTVTAKWNAYYNVKFMNGEEQFGETQSISSGESPAVPSPAPTKTGYNFLGWSEIEGDEVVDVEQIAITENKNFYAKWIVAYDVTFIVNDEQYGDIQHVSQGSCAITPNNPEQVGFIFLGWSTSVSVDDVEIVSSYAINTTTTFIAIFEAIPQYTVYFNSKGGSAVEEVMVYENASLVSAPDDPIKTGYAFQGWSDTDGGEPVGDITAITITANTTFYAVWQKAPYAFFTLNIRQTSNKTMNSSDGEYALTNVEAAVNGGTVYVGCIEAQQKKTILGSNIIQFGGDKAYVKLVLNEVLRVNDTIRFTKTAGNQEGQQGLLLTSQKTRSTGVATDEYYQYVVSESSPLISLDTLYIWRYTSNKTAYISTITITRPDIDAPVLVNAAKSISGDNSITNYTIQSSGQLTISDDATVNNVIIEQGGELVASHALTINGDLIVKTTQGDASAQVFDADNITLQGDAWFEITWGAHAEPSYWHAFTVPFPVDALNGVYDAAGNKLTNEVDYAIMDYHGDLRAQGKYGWRKFRQVMTPGVFYEMTLNGDIPTFRFRKTAAGSLVASTSLDMSQYAVSGAGVDTEDNGWNGVGNMSLASGNALSTGVSTAYILDPDDYTYKLVALASEVFQVGMPFFIQSPNDQTVTMAASLPSMLSAPARATEPANELSAIHISNARYTDNLFVGTTAEQKNAYITGEDLVKWQTSDKPSVPQIYAEDYNHRLALVTTTLSSSAVVSLGLYAPVDGIYTVSAMPAENVTVYLTCDGMPMWNLSRSDCELTLPRGTSSQYGLLLLSASQNTPTDIDDVTENEQPNILKRLYNGQLYIYHQNHWYNAQGQITK